LVLPFGILHNCADHKIAVGIGRVSAKSGKLILPSGRSDWSPLHDRLLGQRVEASHVGAALVSTAKNSRGLDDLTTVLAGKWARNGHPATTDEAGGGQPDDHEKA
jgi:hypothetical protein